MSLTTSELRDKQQSKKNFGALSVDVIFYWIGAAFTDPGTVLVLMLRNLGASAMLIGLTLALRLAAQYGLQIFVAYAMHGKKCQKPFLVKVAGICRLPLLCIPYFIWHASDSEFAKNTALWVVIGLLTILAVGEGLGGVPWTEIVARAFSERTRGRFLTGTLVVSGSLNILIALFIVRSLLALPQLPYPHNFAVLIGISALMFQISTIGILLIDEPPAPADLASHPPLPPMMTYLKRLPKMLHEDKTFARLISIQLLVYSGWAAFPFYANYAKHMFSLKDDWAGTYQMLQAISVALLMPVWGFLSEKRSPALAVRGVAFVCLLTPIAAITLGRINPWLFGSVFLLLGGSLTAGGMWVVTNHFLLSHTDEEERLIFIGMLNLLNLPIGLYVILGALLVRNDLFIEWNGIPLLPVIITLMTAAGFFLSLSLTLSEEDGPVLQSPITK